MKKVSAYLTIILLILSTAFSPPETIAGELENLLSPVSKKPAGKVVKIRTALSLDRVHPGTHVILAVIFDIAKGYHINADQSQIIPIKNLILFPTKVQIIKAPEGIAPEAPRFPKARQLKVEFADKVMMFFTGHNVVYVPIKINEKVNSGLLNLKVQIDYQACDAQTCLFPKKAVVEETFKVVGSDQKPVEINKELFAGYKTTQADVSPKSVGFDLFGWRFSVNVASWLGKIMLMLTALLGGLLLNFTPCVLPIIPIKIISLSNAAENRKRCFILGLAMSLGIMVFWLVLGMMVAWVSGFTAANQLFQYPVFTILIGGMIAVMAVGMCGLFSVRLPGFIYRFNPQQDSLQGSFVLGILTAILSTPCTAPFMGAAAAWAVTQHPLTTIITFTFIGSGMALPYLVLSASPGLVKKMPKTGPASELIKQVMGLFMMAAAAYFIGSGLSAFLSSSPDPPSTLYWWGVMCFCATAGGWFAYRTVQIVSANGQKIFFVVLGILMIAISVIGGVRLTARGPIDWIYYTPERLTEAFQHRKIVVLDFTAEWCLNCKALEHGVLNTRKITDLFANDDIVAIKVDITGRNPAGKRKLREVGSLTIPLLVIYSSDKNMVFKSDFYTTDQIIDAVKKARERMK